MPVDAGASHPSRGDLDAGVDAVRHAPHVEGTVELIVARPAVGERQVLTAGVLDPVVGLVGDDWLTRGSARTPDGAADPLGQVALMSSRAAALIAGRRERWPLAGDQLYVDLDFGVANLLAGSRLQIGTAVVEVTPKVHTGCVKFSERFGAEALRFVNAPVGRELRLRGLFAVVVTGGRVRRGDTVTKLLP